MRYLHTMIRISDIDKSLDFFCEKLGLKEVQRLADAGVTINRPPRDGQMAFVRSPDGISIELLQTGKALPPKEPWASMPSTGFW